MKQTKKNAVTGKGWVGLGWVGLTLLAGCEHEDPGNQERNVSSHSALTLNIQAQEGELDIGGGDLGGGLVTLSPQELAGVRAKASDLELSFDSARKTQTDIIGNPGIPTNWRQHLKIEVEPLESGQSVRLFLELPDIHFPWHEFRNKDLSNEDRAELINLRRAQLNTRLEELSRKLISIGGSNINQYWLVPAVSVIVPASAVAEIADWSELNHGSRDDNQTGEFLAAYSAGYEGRTGVRGDAFSTAGYDGGNGHDYGSSKIRAGVYDSPEIPYQHVGFKEPITLTQRIVKKTNCDYGTCSSYTPTQITSHGGWVAGVLAGSIEGGQDSTYSGTVDRKKRSGIATHPSIYYYSAVNDPWSAATAVATMQSSTSDGLDVMNHSYYWGNCSTCDRTCDKTGFNTALKNSTNAGTLHFFAGGNLNTDDVTCQLVYPGLRRDGITVGGLDTSNTSTSYDATSMWGGSSRGGMDLRINGTVYSGVVSGIDLVAPATYENLYEWTAPSTSTYRTGALSGTSLASPTVAGSAVQLLDSFYQLGWSGMSPRMTQTYLLMMGDGWSHYANAINTTLMDKRSGAGRLHNHFMASANLTNPWGWGCHQSTISNGNTVSYGVLDSNPESSSITTWKAALTWQEDDYNNAADLDLKVYNVCPPGGGEVLVASDLSRDLRARVRLTSSSIGGKCLQYRVSAYFIPAGQTRTFTVCDYFQSGAASDH